MRLRHYSARTEAAYCGWIRRFIVFHDRRHPEELGQEAIDAYLEHLSVTRRVSASTQNQALAALLFLYHQVLGQPRTVDRQPVRAKRPERLPVVLSVSEVAAVLEELEGPTWLMAGLLYGSGLRLMECMSLRIKDIDLEREEVRVRDGKGRKDRITPLPRGLVQPLREHMKEVRRLHEEDLSQGAGWVALPDALDRKYPNAGREWPWQWLFPATRRYTDQRTGQRRRHHLHETVLQRAIHDAARTARISKRVSPHALRHSFATHLRGRVRHPHHPGVTGPPRRRDDHDLHARPQPRRPGRAQPLRQPRRPAKSRSALR